MALARSAPDDRFDFDGTEIDNPEDVISTVDKDILEDLGYSGNGTGTLLGAFEKLL